MTQKRTFKRRTIKKNARNLPENFAVLEGDDWGKAITEIGRRLKEAPVNYANFKDTSFIHDPELDELLTRLLKQNKLLINGGNFTTKAQVRQSLKKSFDQTVQHAELSTEDAQTLKSFTNHLRDILEPLTEVWGRNTVVSFEFRAREKTNRRSYPHIDGATANKMNWKKNLFNNCSFRVLACFNSAATIIYDSKDVELEKKPYTENGLHRFDNIRLKNKNVTLWQPQPWTLSILTSNIWTHDPVGHDWPMGKYPDTLEARCLAVITVSRKPPPGPLKKGLRHLGLS